MTLRFPILTTRGAAPATVAILIALVLTGCASFGSGGAAEPSAYAAMNCNDLNRAIAGVSTTISRTAITRGDVARSKTLSWVPGRTRVTSAVDARLSGKIERLREEERAIDAARARNCANRAE